MRLRLPLPTLPRRRRPPGKGMACAHQRGQVLVLFALFAVALIAIVGFMVDGAILFYQRRALQQVADAAATAAVQEIDEDTYRATNGQVLRLLPDRACQAARERALQGVNDRLARMTSAGLFALRSITARSTTRDVAVRLDAQGKGLFGQAITQVLPGFPVWFGVSATGRATPYYGIQAGSPPAQSTGEVAC